MAIALELSQSCLTQSDGTDTLSYTYNQFNQLTLHKKNNEDTIAYSCNGRGNQMQEVSKQFSITDGGVTTEYLKTTEYSCDIRNQILNVCIETPEADQQTGLLCTFNKIHQKRRNCTSHILNGE